MKLYTYFRSSAAYRVRIALNLKGIEAEQVPVHLTKDGGQQRMPAYLAKNPQALVPALELDDGTVLTQSLAIIEYLDQIKPEPRLIPADPVMAAKVRAVALAIACDVHPLNNLRVLELSEGPVRSQPGGRRRLVSALDPGGRTAGGRTADPGRAVLLRRGADAGRRHACPAGRQCASVRRADRPPAEGAGGRCGLYRPRRLRARPSLTPAGRPIVRL